MSGGHFDTWNGGTDYEMLHGEWCDEELNELYDDLFGKMYYRKTITGREVYSDGKSSFGPRGGGLFESLDFWLSGDTTEESYLDDVRRFKQKWFKRTPKNRVDYYKDKFMEYAQEIMDKFAEELGES